MPCEIKFVLLHFVFDLGIDLGDVLVQGPIVWCDWHDAHLKGISRHAAATNLDRKYVQTTRADQLGMSHKQRAGVLHSMDYSLLGSHMGTSLRNSLVVQDESSLLEA